MNDYVKCVKEGTSAMEALAMFLFVLFLAESHYVEHPN